VGISFVHYPIQLIHDIVFIDSFTRNVMQNNCLAFCTAVVVSLLHVCVRLYKFTNYLERVVTNDFFQEESFSSLLRDMEIVFLM